LALRYRVNNLRVISETIQRVIVFHLDSGRYHSLQQARAEIWNSVHRGAGSEEIAGRD